MENQLMEKKENNKFMTTTGEIELTSDIVRRYLVTGESSKVTDQEIVMFMGMCKANKLNPFNKDAYLIKYGLSAATMIVSKDVYFKRAIEHPKYNGYESGICVEKDGEIVIRVGHVYMKDKEKLLGAWCRVHRKDWDYPVYQEVNFDEYAGRTKTGELNANWSSKPTMMITKVAEATALRKAFTDSLQGMYIAEEIQEPVVTYTKTEEPVIVDDILEEDNINE